MHAVTQIANHNVDLMSFMTLSPRDVTCTCGEVVWRSAVSIGFVLRKYRSCVRSAFTSMAQNSRTPPPLAPPPGPILRPTNGSSSCPESTCQFYTNHANQGTIKDSKSSASTPCAAHTLRDSAVCATVMAVYSMFHEARDGLSDRNF